MLTGPATDNQVGIDIATTRMEVPAFNAITDGTGLGDEVARIIGFGEASS